MRYFAPILLLIPFLLLVGCLPKVEPEPGFEGLFAVTVPADYPIGMESGRVQWIMALNPKTEELLGAQELISGERAFIAAPAGYDAEVFDLVWVYGYMNGSGYAYNTQVYLYRDFPRSERTLASPGSGGGGAAPFPLPPAYLEGLNDAEGANQNYWLSSDLGTIQGTPTGSSGMEFGGGSNGSYNGTYLLIREGHEEPTWDYQVAAGITGQDTLVFQNDDWEPATLRRVLIEDEPPSWSLTSYGQPNPGSSFWLGEITSNLNLPRVEFPTIPQIFREHNIRFTGDWSYEDRDQQYMYQSRGHVPSMIPRFDVTTSLGLPSFLGFTATPFTGVEMDYARWFFYFTDDLTGDQLYYIQYADPNAEMHNTEIDWPGEMQQQMPMLGREATWYPNQYSALVYNYELVFGYADMMRYFAFPELRQEYGFLQSMHIGWY